MIVGFQLQMYDFAGFLVEHNRFEQILYWTTLTTLPLPLTENQKKKLKGKTRKDYILEHSDSLVVFQSSYCSTRFIFNSANVI